MTLKFLRYYSNGVKQTQRLHSFGKYAYYDSVVEVGHLNMVRSDAYYIARQKKQQEEPTSFVFDTRSKDNKPTFSQVFGGSTKTATKSSRRDISYRLESKNIGGVKVPKRPIEPDNCCMSGCINCVWELFNDDLEEWKFKRIQAAKELLKQDKTKKNLEKWPTDWESPPKMLDKAFVSHDLPKNSEKDVEEIRGMPVGLQVFAMFEKKKKKERQEKGEKKETKGKQETQHNVNSTKKRITVSAAM